MDFTGISKKLVQSATSGDIYEIVMTFIRAENVLAATTRTWANNWLDYSPKNAKKSAAGYLTTFKEQIDMVIEDYCTNYINNAYTGNLPGDITATEFLSRNEDAKNYYSKDEYMASGEILSAINNGTYSDMALNKIFLQRWPE